MNRSFDIVGRIFGEDGHWNRQLVRDALRASADHAGDIDPDRLWRELENRFRQRYGMGVQIPDRGR